MTLKVNMIIEEQGGQSISLTYTSGHLKCIVVGIGDLLSFAKSFVRVQHAVRTNI